MVPRRLMLVQISMITPPHLDDLRVTLTQYIEPEIDDVDISKEPVLVAIGRGLQNEDDIELAGLFDIGVRPDCQGRGYGRSIVRTALRWAKHQGAKSGWLQVEKANASANELYSRLGFETVYSYTYRIKKD